MDDLYFDGESITTSDERINFNRSIRIDDVPPRPVTGAEMRSINRAAGKFLADRGIAWGSFAFPKHAVPNRGFIA